MALTSSIIEGRNTITSYRSDAVVVDKTEYRKSIILLPDQVITNWTGSAHLTKAHINDIPVKAAEVIIIGTGKIIKFFDAHIFEKLINANVGYEIMDTAAACRTYNLLVADNRAVVAALVISE